MIKHYCEICKQELPAERPPCESEPLRYWEVKLSKAASQKHVSECEDYREVCSDCIEKIQALIVNLGPDAIIAGS